MIALFLYAVLIVLFIQQTFAAASGSLPPPKEGDYVVFFISAKNLKFNFFFYRSFKNTLRWYSMSNSFRRKRFFSWLWLGFWLLCELQNAVWRRSCKLQCRANCQQNARWAILVCRGRRLCVVGWWFDALSRRCVLQHWSLQCERVLNTSTAENRFV